MFKVGDHVRTNSEWNARHDKIEGVVKEVKVLKFPKTEFDRDGFAVELPGQYDYTTLLVIEGEDNEIHESWYEKVAE